MTFQLSMMCTTSCSILPPKSSCKPCFNPCFNPYFILYVIVNSVRPRKEVLTLREERNTPGEGIFFRDLKLLGMRTERQRLERDAKAMVSDRLIADKEYMTLAALRNRAEEHLRSRPPASPTSVQPDDFEQAFRERPEYKHQRQIEERKNQIRRGLEQEFEPYKNEKLGVFMLKVEKAKNDLQTQYHENAKLDHPEEFRIVEKIDYKRIHFNNLAALMAKQLASDTEPPDSLGQMKDAAKIQQIWYTSTADWETRQRYEEEYEQLNPIMKRWLQRVKPYRYSDPSDKKTAPGDSNE